MEEQVSVSETSSLVMPSFGLELGPRGWLPFSPFDGVEAGLQPPQITEQQL